MTAAVGHHRHSLTLEALSLSLSSPSPLYPLHFGYMIYLANNKYLHCIDCELTLVVVVEG